MEPERVWDLVSDPHNLPRWWPQVMRVEDVHDPGGKRARWTAVLETERGTGIRADYRCTAATAAERYEWEQEIAGTPFERILKSSTTRAEDRPADDGAKVTIAATESSAGLSRLGWTMMRARRAAASTTRSTGSRTRSSACPTKRPRCLSGLLLGAGRSARDVARKDRLAGLLEDQRLLVRRLADDVLDVAHGSDRDVDGLHAGDDLEHRGRDREAILEVACGFTASGDRG